MQVAIDEVVDVVAMTDSLVAAVRTVDVIRVMAGAAMLRRATLGVLFTDLECVLVAVVLVRVVKFAVMQVVNVIAVDNGGMAAIGPVGMRMIGDRVTGWHRSFLKFW